MKTQDQCPLERISSALAAIAPNDRETWVRMAMAIKSELGEAGFLIWDEWSQQADSYKTADACTVWRGIKEVGHVGIGTLFFMACQAGWRDEGNQARLSPEAMAERRRCAEERAVIETDLIARERAATGMKAAAIWKASRPASPDNPYLQRKRVKPVTTLRECEASDVISTLGYPPKSKGEPLEGRLLVVPVKQDGRLSTLELIDGSGRKAALAGHGTKTGGYWCTAALPDVVSRLLIGEGVATVLSAHEATGHPAVAALSSTNLVKVARSLRDRYPTSNLIVLADLLKGTNTPDPHAVEAARLVKGRLATPVFSEGRSPA